jgi:imidazolonepropionase-like amidohydrolase
MQLMVEKGGMSPMEVLVAATGDAAEVCGLSEQTGTLEAGKWADVIVLDGNPLDDLTALSRVKLVFKEGVRYEPQALTGAIGRYPL